MPEALSMRLIEDEARKLSAQERRQRQFARTLAMDPTASPEAIAAVEAGNVYDPGVERAVQASARALRAAQGKAELDAPGFVELSRELGMQEAHRRLGPPPNPAGINPALPSDGSNARAAESLAAMQAQRQKMLDSQVTGYVREKEGIGENERIERIRTEMARELVKAVQVGQTERTQIQANAERFRASEQRAGAENVAGIEQRGAGLRAILEQLGGFGQAAMQAAAALAAERVRADAARHAADKGTESVQADTNLDRELMTIDKAARDKARADELALQREALVGERRPRVQELLRQIRAEATGEGVFNLQDPQLLPMLADELFAEIESLPPGPERERLLHTVRASLTSSGEGTTSALSVLLQAPQAGTLLRLLGISENESASARQRVLEMLAREQALRSQ